MREWDGGLNTGIIMGGLREAIENWEEKHSGLSACFQVHSALLWSLILLITDHKFPTQETVLIKTWELVLLFPSCFVQGVQI